jgi:hypothetical protein
MSSKESMCHNHKDLTANQHHYEYIKIIFIRKKIPWLLVRTQTITTERPPLVGEVSANF